jgi:GNAT superfamily N-acetyltransferase
MVALHPAFRRVGEEKHEMAISACEFTVVEQNGEESRPRLAALTAAVYPPHVLELVPWRTIESARAHHRVLILDHDEAVLAAAGLVVRDGLLDGRRVRMGGVGGVMTLPARQRTGLGRVAMQAIGEIMARYPKIQFGVLFCEPKNIAFYQKLGWSIFKGVVKVQQSDGTRVYDIMQAMVLPVHGAAPAGGTLDLCGLPW